MLVKLKVLSSSQALGPCFLLLMNWSQNWPLPIHAIEERVDTIVDTWKNPQQPVNQPKKSHF